MVSTLNDKKYNRVRRNFCFYLDVQDHGLARSLSRRIQDMGLQQEVFLTSRVSHVIREKERGAGEAAPAQCARRDGRRADAMLDRVRHTPPPLHHRYVTLSVHKAIALLDKLYDTFFAASNKTHVRHLTKHFIKIEFLDKWYKPLYKEFDEWPEISIDPDPPKDKIESPKNLTTTQPHNTTSGQKMTRKSRPRIKEKEKEKEAKGGYCEMCRCEFSDGARHRRSPHHAAFVRDHHNFLALDSLIASGADVATFLAGASPVHNGERRSQRNVCNGDIDKTKRSKRSQSPDSTVEDTPKRNGVVDDDRKHNTRNKASEDDKQYYKVVGVSTKLRSSGGFTRRKSPPSCNGAKPLVVKFRKVRRSELSVLSDEAEQFMFPKRASSTSSTSSDEDDKVLSPKRKSPARPPPPVTMERRRLARPGALKEESSEEDSWPEDKRRRKRRGPTVAKRTRTVPCKTLAIELPVVKDPETLQACEEQQVPAIEPPAASTPQEEVSPLREEADKCMRWEEGRLKYTPAVEQLEFAFESVPRSEPWFESFQRQDQDKRMTKNIPQYFALYSSNVPKLPYEIGQLPPLKPNCCPLSDLVKQREDKPGPSRSYGTRGMKRQKIRKRTAAILALESHPRKSPREHASTLAMLGSAGLLRRRADDDKSTASEDTASDSHPLLSETQEASERLQQFLSEVFEDAAEFDVSDDGIEGDAAVTTSANVLDVSSLVSECDDCDLIRNEIKKVAERPKRRRGKFKKKNRTGWPSKRKNKKDSRTNSSESEHKTESLDQSSAEPPDDETRDATSEDDNSSEIEGEKTVIQNLKSEEDSQEKTVTEESVSQEMMDVDSSDNKLLIDLKVVVDEEKHQTKRERHSRSSGSDDDKELKKKKRALQGLCEWLQPVVRVARVEPPRPRPHPPRPRLRSAARPRSARFR